MRLNLILSTILQEKERIDRMLSKYQEELGTLPKGTISEKKVKQSTYFYLKYREGKKVISRYIPQKDVDAVREQVEKRRHIETMIRSLQEERAIAEKALEGQLWFYIMAAIWPYRNQSWSGNYEGEAYDFIFGPVANDDVYRTFTLYTAGVLTKEQTLEQLKIKKLYNQLVLTTEKALSYLRFVGTVPEEEF